MKKIDLNDIGISSDRAEIIRRFKQEKRRMSKKEWMDVKKASGMSYSQFGNYFGLKQKKAPSMEFIVKLAHTLKKPVDYFLFGKEATLEKMIEIPCIEPILSEDGTPIYKKKNCCLFDIQYAKNITENPYNLICMKEEGDSMQPAIVKNNYVLIDRIMKRPIEGNIYAFSYKEAKNIQIKRFSFKYDQINLISDNRIYESYSVKEDNLNIIGLVIFTFRHLI